MANKVITVTDPSIVTNDTLVGYNNYSDIDGQLGTTMTPTEATNGKTITLSDGVVHEVTTKPVGTTNGEFSAVVSNAVTVDLVSTDWTLSGASYDSKSVDISAQTTQPKGMFFKPDGLKMYIADNVADDLFEYDLSVAWDVSTASYLKSHDILSGDPNGLFISSDGLNMVFPNLATPALYSRGLTTPWEFTTGILGNKLTDTTPTYQKQIYISDDGIDLWCTQSSDLISKWTFGTAWDASTLTDDGVTFDTTVLGSGATKGIFFSDTGKKMFVAVDDSSNAGANSKIFELNLSIAWDITTATLSGNTLDITPQNDAPFDIYIKADGSKLYVTGFNSTQAIYQYSMG